MSESRALAPVAIIPPSRAPALHSSADKTMLDIGTFDLLHRVATVMADSVLVPEALTHTGAGANRERLPEKAIVANCFLVAELAHRWKASPFAVAQCVAIVHGKICVEGKLVHAMLEAQLGVRLRYDYDGKSGDQLGVVVSGTLPGESEARTVEGTVADWRTSGNNSPWGSAKNWRRQLRYRGAREWARAHAPAVLLGIYTADEFSDDPDERDITPSAAALAPPDIPEPPKAVAPPPPAVPDIPDIPDAAASAPQRSDADFLAALDTDLAVCALGGEINEVLDANRSEAATRGLQQAMADLIDRHRERITKAAAPKTPAAIAAEEAYVRIMQAMRAAATLDELAAVWKAAWGEIKNLPDTWRAELMADKDRRKAQLQPKEQAA